MRIGTWNVDYGRGERNADRLAILASKNVDIWVLTETHSDIDLSRTHNAVNSEPRPGLNNKKVNVGSTWVTIWSRFPLVRMLSVPDARRMVSAVFDTSSGYVAVAGIVLPWHSDIGDEPVGKPPAVWDEHKRVLRDQLPDFLRTFGKLSVACGRVIAGDFNSHQAIPYPLSHAYPHDEKLRRRLSELISSESFICHTANEKYPHPLPPRHVEQTLIDHVCTDFGVANSLETWSGVDGKKPRLSDHPGVLVDLSL